MNPLTLIVQGLVSLIPVLTKVFRRDPGTRLAKLRARVVILEVRRQQADTDREADRIDIALSRARTKIAQLEKDHA